MYEVSSYHAFSIAIMRNIFRAFEKRGPHLVKLEMRHFNATEETATTANDSKTPGKVVQIDDLRIQNRLGKLVRGTVEETLNGMLDTGTDALCGAQRYGCNPDRACGYRAGIYEQNLLTKAGKVNLKVP